MEDFHTVIKNLNFKLSFYRLIKIIETNMREIYKDKYLFASTMDRYYCSNCSPFISAYNQFMNMYISGIDLDSIFCTISIGILKRILHERNSNNPYIVFKVNK